MEVLSVLDDVGPVQNGADGRRVSGRPSDAVLLHRPDQGRVGIAGRRLGKVLSRLEVQAFQLLPLGQGRQPPLFFLFLLVLALFINGGVSGEFQTAAAGPEPVDARLDLH